MKIIKLKYDFSNRKFIISLNDNSLFIYQILIYFIILYFIINISKEEEYFHPTSKITLTIKGTGKQRILSDKSFFYYYTNRIFIKPCSFNYIPDDILVNGVSQKNKDKFVYNLKDQINTITIIWNNQITNCCSMFRGLSNILKIDLSNFNTSLVTDMSSMFEGCSSLTSLNLLNFNTSLVTDMSWMFYGCSSLTSLNLLNFNTSLVKDMSWMFYGCNSLISLDLYGFNSNLVTDMSWMFYECSSLMSLDIYNFNTSLVTDISWMFYGCSSLISLDLYNFHVSLKSNIYDMFLGCNSNLIYCINDEKYNKISPLLSNFIKDCNNICFVNLGHKLIKEKEKCVDNCYDDAKYKYEYNNLCYNLCPDGTYISSNNNYLCEKKCPDDKPFENTFNNECTQECSYIELFKNKCKLRNNNIMTKDEILRKIKNDILNGNLDNLINGLSNNNKEYLIIDNNNIKYEITTTYRQNKNNENVNISTIRLGECENILKNYYKIDEKDPLVIFKIDIYEEELLIPIVEYEVYDLKNKKQLDLNPCNNSKIEILYPAIIEENNEFKYNKDSNYYNDICYTYTTENGTYITLGERKKEFNEKKMSICEANCNYIVYDSTIKKSKCECQIKLNLELISEVKNNYDKFLNIFTNIKNGTNIKVIKCYKELFCEDGLKNNIGNYIILSIILSDIICLIFYNIKGFKFLNNIIDNYISKNINLNKIDINNKKKEEILSIKNKNNNIIINNNNNNKQTNINKKNVRKKRKSFNLNTLKTNEENNNNMSSSFVTIKRNKNKNNFKNEGIVDKNDYEINSLNYKEALKSDKRTFIEYYISLLKRKQLLIFTFYINNDYNSKSIKICLFLFLFALYYTVNALFFNEAIMQIIYINEGKYNFIYQISNIIYSTLISNVIGILLKFLSLTEQNIIAIKKIKDEKEIIKKKKCLNIKIILFFILNFLFLVLFWYYISCFCAIFKNTQIHLIKDTLISFGLPLLYSAFLCLLPGILRIPSLKASKQDKECIYKLSKFIEKIL